MGTIGFISFVLQAITWIVIVDALSSWIVRDPSRFPRNITGPILDPLYRPIRAVVKPEALGGIDLSPIILIVGLRLIAGALVGASFGL